MSADQEARETETADPGTVSPEPGEPPAGPVEPGFETRLASLEEAVEKLESGELSLEEAIAEFESGFRSWRHCQELLRRAEKRIEVLCKEADAAGELPFSWKPLTSSAEDELSDSRENGED